MSYLIWSSSMLYLMVLYLIVMSYWLMWYSIMPFTVTPFSVIPDISPNTGTQFGVCTDCIVNWSQVRLLGHLHFTFTFMHLADAFIQSDLHCIQVSTFYQLLLSLGIEPMILALLAPCSTSWATGKLCSGHSVCVCVFSFKLSVLQPSSNFFSDIISQT